MAGTNRNHKGEHKRVDLNRANREELMQIPGVGPHMAERIIEYREQRHEQHAERRPPDRPAGPWQTSEEREFDELLDRLYI